MASLLSSTAPRMPSISLTRESWLTSSDCSWPTSPSLTTPTRPVRHVLTSSTGESMPRSQLPRLSPRTRVQHHAPRLACDGLLEGLAVPGRRGRLVRRRHAASRWNVCARSGGAGRRTQESARSSHGQTSVCSDAAAGGPLGSAGGDRLVPDGRDSDAGQSGGWCDADAATTLYSSAHRRFDSVGI